MHSLLCTVSHLLHTEGLLLMFHPSLCAGKIVLPKDVVNTDQEKWKNYVKERRCEAKGRGSIYSNKGGALTGLLIAARQAWVWRALLQLPQSDSQAAQQPVDSLLTLPHPAAIQAAHVRTKPMHLSGLLNTSLQVYAAISAARRSCAPRRTAPAAACWTIPGPAKVSPLVLQDLIAPSQLVMQAVMEVDSHLWLLYITSQRRLPFSSAASSPLPYVLLLPIYTQLSFQLDLGHLQGLTGPDSCTAS